jgi:hypothetical protein
MVHGSGTYLRHRRADSPPGRESGRRQFAVVVYPRHLFFAFISGTGSTNQMLGFLLNFYVLIFATVKGNQCFLSGPLNGRGRMQIYIDCFVIHVGALNPLAHVRFPIGSVGGNIPHSDNRWTPTSFLVED